MIVISVKPNCVECWHRLFSRFVLVPYYIILFVHLLQHMDPSTCEKLLIMLIICVHNPKRLDSVHILAVLATQWHSDTDTRNTRKDGPRPIRQHCEQLQQTKNPSPVCARITVAELISHAKCIGCMRALSYQQSFVILSTQYPVDLSGSALRTMHNCTVYCIPETSLPRMFGVLHIDK